MPDEESVSPYQRRIDLAVAETSMLRWLRKNYQTARRMSLNADEQKRFAREMLAIDAELGLRERADEEDV